MSLPGPMPFVQTDLCLPSFHKDYETSSGLSKKRRIIYLDNLLVISSSSHTALDCSDQELFQALGLIINKNISQMVPIQEIVF